uniref:Uncharacterized protein n=1 Tax=Rhizophora mucronata TaxID=61149 RepID=A0A2P2JNB3_RHIMU
MILEILVRWISLLTAFSHCLENKLNRIFIMHRLLILFACFCCFLILVPYMWASFCRLE